MKTNEIVKVLEKAIELLSKEGVWIKGVYAKNSLGRVVPMSHFGIEEPACFCGEGAILYACEKLDVSDRVVSVVDDFIFKRRERYDDCAFLAEYNDKQSSAAPVIALLNDVISYYKNQKENHEKR